MWRAGSCLLLVASCGRIGFEPTGDGALPVGRWQTGAMAPNDGCAITTAGELWCAGWNTDGECGFGTTQPTAPAQRVGTDSNWAMVSMFDAHTCGLRTDNTLWCWGSNDGYALGMGTLNMRYPSPVQLPMTWKTVATGRGYGCAINGDDTLWCWGSNGSGTIGNNSRVDQPSPVQIGTATWTAIAASAHHTCGIQSDGSMWCWGYNGSGQVGDNTFTDRLVPTVIAPGTTWLAIGAGAEHTCGLRSDNSAWCWGSNTFGELGDGTLMSHPAPQRVVVPSLIAITSADYFSCGTTATGELYCWGNAGDGRIPGPDVGPISTPKLLSSPRVKTLYTGAQSTCVIDPDAHLFCSGPRSWGQTGIASTNRATPTRVDQRTDWTSIVVNDNHACGQASDGAVWCWGRGIAGELGDGAAVDRQTPVVAIGVTNVLSIDLDYETALARTGSGNYLIWGYDFVGNQPRPTAAAFSAGALDAATGAYHGCTIASGGQLTCYGSNTHGQLGDGTHTDNPAGVTIAPGMWTSVIAAAGSTCATRDVATVPTLFCWGDHYPTATGSTVDVVTPTQAQLPSVPTQIDFDIVFGCGLIGPGELWCWGDGGYGQIGDGTRTERLVPVRVGTRSDWTDLDVGDDHVCAIAADHTLWCWGRGDGGQLGDGAKVQRTAPTQIGTDTDWKDVGCGDEFTCAIKLDGTRWCFGENVNGQLGDGLGWLTDLVVVP